jgi:hypothetical protein
MNDARWKRQTNCGRLVLLVAATDFVTEDLSFKVAHGDWAATAGVSERTVDDVAADATGIGLLVRSRLRRQADGMLGTYTYRFDPDLLGATTAPGTRRNHFGSSSGAVTAPQEVQVKALGKNDNGGGTTDVVDSSSLDHVGGGDDIPGRDVSLHRGEQFCPNCIRLTRSRLIGGNRVCGLCDSEAWGS